MLKVGGPKIATNATLRSNPMMAWIEMTLGLALDDNGARLRRATPIDLSAAAGKLAADTSLDVAFCRSQLELALETAGRQVGNLSSEGFVRDLR